MVRVTRKSGASAGCDEPRLKSASSQVPGFGNVIFIARRIQSQVPCFERGEQEMEYGKMFYFLLLRQNTTTKETEKKKAFNLDVHGSSVKSP